MERLQPPLPEGLLRSRHAGWIYADQLPWLDRDHDEEVGMSLLTFPEGDVLIAAAGTPTMNKISETTRKKNSMEKRRSHSRRFTMAESSAT